MSERLHTCTHTSQFLVSYIRVLNGFLIIISLIIIKRSNTNHDIALKSEVVGFSFSLPLTRSRLTVLSAAALAGTQPVGEEYINIIMLGLISCCSL